MLYRRQRLPKTYPMSLRSSTGPRVHGLPFQHLHLGVRNRGQSRMPRANSATKKCSRSGPKYSNKVGPPLCIQLAGFGWPRSAAHFGQVQAATSIHRFRHVATTTTYSLECLPRLVPALARAEVLIAANHARIAKRRQGGHAPPEVCDGRNSLWCPTPQGHSNPTVTLKSARFDYRTQS